MHPRPGDRVGECGSSILNYLLAYIKASGVPTQNNAK